MGSEERISLWNPGNWIALGSLGLMRRIGRLPLPKLQRIGRHLGTLIWYTVPYRKSVGMVNLRVCFPDWTEEQLKAMLKAHYQSMGIGAMELAAAWYGDPAHISEYADIEGLEHFKAANDAGDGVLLFTGHFTTLEIIGRLLLYRQPISCIYRAPKHPVFRREMETLRRREMVGIYDADEANQMIRALRRGEIIWYTPDQGRAIKQSELSPFFGEPAVTNAVSGRLAKMGRARVIPFTGYRKPDGRYQIRIFPAQPEYLEADPQRVADMTNQWIERFVDYAPEQYFWLHRRFKRRGQNLPNLYKNA